MMRSDQQNLVNSGIQHMLLGEFDRAVRSFEKLRLPLPAVAAMNWAAICVHEHKYSEALEILGRIDRSFRSKNRKDVRNLIACRVFEDILQLISNNGLRRPSQTPGKRRLVKLIKPGISTFLWFLDSIGNLATAFGRPDAGKIREFAQNCRLQSWIHGFSAKKEFIEGKVNVEKFKDYEFAVDIYHTIFLEFLDHWIRSGEQIGDLLLATVQLEDALALYCIIREKRPSVVLEIGSFIGFSTCMIAQSLKDNGKGVIHCVDPNVAYFSVKSPLSHAEDMVKRLELDNYVHIHNGFFSEPLEHLELKNDVLGRRISEIVPPIDLAFIDGDHATYSVLQDFILLLPALSTSATVVFHDTNTWASVRQAIAIILQDTISRQQMRYFEVHPPRKEGLGIIEINKKIPSPKNDGCDKESSV